MHAFSVWDWIACSFTAMVYPFYVHSILKSDKRPTLSFWVACLLADSSLWYTMWRKNEMMYQIIVYTLGVVAILITCLYKRGTMGWKFWSIDTACTALVVLALYALINTNNAVLATGLLLFALAIGTIPLFVNLVTDPWRESLVPWALAWFGALFGLFAIPAMTVVFAAPPITFFCLNCAAMVLLFRRYLPRYRRT